MTYLQYLGCNRRRGRNDVTLVTGATAVLGSDEMKAAVTNAPIFAYATEALTLRFPSGSFRDYVNSSRNVQGSAGAAQAWSPTMCKVRSTLRTI
jgi:hypothetical protein